ncbi:hypothetical protein ACPCAC_05725 [Streptomyces lavendulocolor]
MPRTRSPRRQRRLWRMTVVAAAVSGAVRAVVGRLLDQLSA